MDPVKKKRKSRKLDDLLTNDDSHNGKAAPSCISILDDAETTTNQDQLLPPKNPAATHLTCSQKRKRKKERDRIHCTNAEFAAQGSKPRSIGDSKAKKKKKKKKTKPLEACDPLGSSSAKSMQSGHVDCAENSDLNARPELMTNLASERELSATGEESSLQSLGLTTKKETDENTQVNQDVLRAGGRDGRRKKHKGKKKKSSSAYHKAADTKVCVPSLDFVKSGSVESLLNHSNKEGVEDCDGNTEQEFSNKVGKANEATPSKEKKVRGNEKYTREDQVHISENSLSTLLANSCRRDSISCEEPGDILHHTVPVFPTREDSLLDANTNGSSKKRSRSREKKKEDTSCQEAEITTNEDQVLPPKNSLLNSMIQEGSGQLTQKLCEKPAATNMTCSQKRKRKKERDRNTLKEDDVDNHCSEVDDSAKYNTISEAERSQSMSVEEIVPQIQTPKAKKRKKKRTSKMEVCDPLGNTLATSMQNEPVECMENKDLNAARELMSNLASKRENSATGEESSFANMGKTKKKETDENTEVDEDVVGLGANVCDSRGEKQMGKKKKITSADHRTADMEVCDPSVITLLASAGSESVECLLDHSNREDMDNCDGNAGQEYVGAASTSKSENSAAMEESGLQNPRERKEKTKVEDTLSNQDALGAEDVSMVEIKTKKRKKKKRDNYLNKNTDNMEEETDDVSIPRKDDEPKFDREKPETSLSSSILIHNNVAQSVVSPETGLPRCSCGGQSTRKLVVLDLNGILADVVQGNTGQFVPDGHVSYRKIFRRPFLASFLDFCFERFDVGIWSSRRVGLDYMINVVMRNHARNLFFCFDQHICTLTEFNSQENSTKPLFLKDLRKVWDRYETCFTCEKRKYDETNTLLIDDSPHKALCNPPYTGIFPWPYRYTDRGDSALGPEGELRKYLAGLADSENVQKFVEENPFGQTAITEAHESWEYYSKVIEAHKLDH